MNRTQAVRLGESGSKEEEGWGGLETNISTILSVTVYFKCEMQAFLFEVLEVYGGRD